MTDRARCSTQPRDRRLAHSLKRPPVVRGPHRDIVAERGRYDAPEQVDDSVLVETRSKVAVGVCVLIPWMRGHAANRRLDRRSRYRLVRRSELAVHGPLAVMVAHVKDVELALDGEHLGAPHVQRAACLRRLLHQIEVGPEVVRRVLKEHVLPLVERARGVARAGRDDEEDRSVGVGCAHLLHIKACRACTACALVDARAQTPRLEQ